MENSIKIVRFKEKLGVISSIAGIIFMIVLLISRWFVSSEWTWELSFQILLFCIIFFLVSIEEHELVFIACVITIVLSCISFSNNKYVTVQGNKTTLDDYIVHHPFALRTIIDKEIVLDGSSLNGLSWSAKTNEGKVVIFSGWIFVRITGEDEETYKAIAQHFPLGNSKIKSYLYKNLMSSYSDHIKRKSFSDISKKELFKHLAKHLESSTSLPNVKILIGHNELKVKI